MNLVEWHYEGGLDYMLPISILLITILVLFSIFMLRKFKRQLIPKWLEKSIYQIGLFSFFFGLLGQILGLVNGLDAIEKAGAISQGILAGGLKVSFYPTIYGLIVFLISQVFNFIMTRLSPSS